MSILDVLTPRHLDLDLSKARVVIDHQIRIDDDEEEPKKKVVDPALIRQRNLANAKAKMKAIEKKIVKKEREITKIHDQSVENLAATLRPLRDTLVSLRDAKARLERTITCLQSPIDKGVVP